MLSSNVLMGEGEAVEVGEISVVRAVSDVSVALLVYGTGTVSSNLRIISSLAIPSASAS